jgi:hypothetical protein
MVVIHLYSCQHGRDSEDGEEGYSG